MLSHQHPQMLRQQRIHTRQQSTPTAFEVHQASSFPDHTDLQSQHNGMSLVAPGANFRDFEQVGITNTGQPQQHNLQVAQQQPQAHPGQQQMSNEQHQLTEDEFRRMQHQQLDAQLNSIFANYQTQRYAAFDSVKMEKSRSNPEHQFAQVLPQPPSDCNSTQFLQPFPAQPNAARPVSAHGIHNTGRGRTQEPKGLWHLQRAFTPPVRPSSQAQSLLTPETSPHSDIRARQQDTTPCSPRFVDKDATIRQSRGHTPIQTQSLPCGMPYMDPNATIRANAQHNASDQPSYLEIFTESPCDERIRLPPSPPETAPIKTILKFDVSAMSEGTPLESMPRLALAPTHLLDNGTGVPQLEIEVPVNNNFQGMDFEYSQSNESSHSARSSVDFGSTYGSPIRGMLSPTTMSIAELNLDSTVEDTVITAEEVQSYMSEQDTNTGKWTCKYPGCGKTFGRRENIKSHVQTHLGDRQFRCLHCNKKFVRQHDLKRHAKIHSGVKPYPCDCGNSFARHDALTRHKQRGICVGGFAGVKKKPVKRGRPRKHRPGDDERMNKSSRTSKRVQTKSSSSTASTTSEYSCSDSNASPQAELLDVENAAADQLGLFLNGETLDLPAEFFSCNESHASSPQSVELMDSPEPSGDIDWTASPSEHTFNEPSESRSQMQTTVSLAAMSQQPHSGSQLGSQPGSPPGLSHSSPPLSAQLLDVNSRSALRSAGTDCVGGSTSDDTSTNFDIFAQDDCQSFFGSPWNAGSYFDYDKNRADLRMEDYTNGNFCDEPLFTNDLNSNNGLI